MKIWNEILLIDKLRKEHKLTAEEYKILLECQDSNCLSYLQKQAQEEALSRFGNRVFIRGLIEVTNRCRNNCYYCGIRKGNPSVSRYGLTRETILACCREGYEAGFRTFVMQGGEDPAMTDEWTEQTVASIHRLFLIVPSPCHWARRHGRLMSAFPCRRKSILTSPRDI